jgi:hypothetical protein
VLADDLAVVQQGSEIALDVVEELLIVLAARVRKKS